MWICRGRDASISAKKPLVGIDERQLFMRNQQIMEPTIRFERTTGALRMRCSTS
jgi:hypothetical protein